MVHFSGVLGGGSEGRESIFKGKDLVDPGEDFFVVWGRA
jgi:hypothetical protein